MVDTRRMRMRTGMKKGIRRKAASVTMAAVLGLGVFYTGYPAFGAVTAEEGTKSEIDKVILSIGSADDIHYVGTKDYGSVVNYGAIVTAYDAAGVAISSDQLGEVSFSYCDYDDSAPTYADGLPETPGKYYVKAKIGESEAYSAKESENQEILQLVYLNPSEITDIVNGEYLTVSGVENDFYAQDSITVTPPDGYLVKPQNGSGYKVELTLTKNDLYEADGSHKDYYVSLMRKDDGAQTDYISASSLNDRLHEIIFDEQEPVISFVADGEAVTVGEGAIVPARKLEIKVADENLSEVDVEDGNGAKTYVLSNGDFEKTEDGMITFNTVLETAQGDSRKCYVIAWDFSKREYSVGYTLEYARQKAEATVTVPNVKVGESYEPTLTTNSDGASSVSYLYSEKGNEDSAAYVTDKPVSAGEYQVLAVVPETAEYEATSAMAVFEISRYTPQQAEIAVPDTRIGTDYEPVLTTDSDGKSLAEITYKSEGEPDSAYTADKPEAAGSYVVRAVIPQTDKYESATCVGSFKINLQASEENKVEIADTYVGTDYTPVLTTDSDGRDQVQYTYRKEGEDASAGSSVKPTQAGSYIVRAVVPATATYEEVVCEGSFQIKRHTASSATVTVADSYVGETYEPTVTTDSDGKDAAVFTYRGQGEAETDFTETKPELPGAYVVRAVIPATDQYEEISCEGSFRIRRHTPTTAKVEVADTLAGTDYEPVVTTDSDGAYRAEFQYKEATADSEAYGEEKPVKAGSYSVLAVIPETNKYEMISCESTFRITLRKPQTAVVTVADVTEGQTPQPVLTTDSDGKEQASYLYKAKGQEDSAYSETVPTQEGEYAVKAIVPETDIYEDISCEGSFQIRKASEEGTTEEAVTQEDTAEDKTTETDTTENPDNTTEEPGQSGSTSEEPGSTTEEPGQSGGTTEEPGQSGSTSGEPGQSGGTSEEPGQPGSTSEELGQKGSTTEEPGQSGGTSEEPGQPGSTSGESGQPGSTSEEPGGASQQPGGSTGQTGSATEQTGGVPVGTEKKTASATVTMPDIYVGTEYEPSLKTDSDGTAVIQYKLKGNPDNEYTGIKPVQAGTYVVRVVIPETDRFKAVSCTDEFEIKKYTPEGKLTAADVYVDQEVKPVLTTDSDGKEAAVLTYKKKGQADSTYTEDAPVKAGSYKVRAVVPETEKYLGETYTAEFKIQKRAANLSVQLSDKYVGTAYAPEIRTDSNAVANVKFEYKQEDESDSAYAEKKPKAAGHYLVRAILPETDGYEADMAIKSFELRYLPAPERAYTLRAKEGKNSYYTSVVYLRAPEGYQIRKDGDSGFAEQIRYENGLTRFYLKRVSDGALTDAISFDREVRIDETAPAPSRVTAQDGRTIDIEDGSDVFAESLTIRIEDDNLAFVRINGEETEITETGADFVFNSDNGYKVIQVEAEDIAGNVWTRRFTILSEWMKTNIVPANRKLPLETEKAYQLDSGEWQVNEDATVYGGGQAFYVPENGDYTFQNK